MLSTVVIADDQIRVRQAVRAMVEDDPELIVVGEARSGQETLHLVDKLQPDVLVLDLSLGDMDGMEVACRLHDISPDTDVVIYSMYGNTRQLFKARQLGVKGYVAKESPPYDLVKAIKAVLAGDKYFALPLSQSN
jgi:DNA-binding NarL/FixJ family response regulator